MPLHCEPASLYILAKCTLTNDVAFRVRILLHAGPCSRSAHRTLSYLEKVISSLPPLIATDVAHTALRCTDLLCERSAPLPSLLRLLVRVLIHDSTVAFPIRDLYSYQLRQAVENRLCDLRHLQTYCNLQHFHENFNILLTFQRLQSLSNLRQVYLTSWCSDEIIHLLGKSCPNLQLLDAQSSLSVTDASVPSLIRCVHLKVLLVYSTSISETGYLQLLESLPLLQKIGPCHRLNSIIAKIRESGRRNLSLREYESSESPDENVAIVCPYLTSVHLYGTQLKEDLNLPHNITHLKLQSYNSIYLNKTLTPSLIHLDLFECPISEETMTTIADVCKRLRVLRLNPPQLDNELRLVLKKSKSLRHLEELDIPDSALAMDLIELSPKIREIHVQPQKCLSPLAFQRSFWTDAVLRKIMAKNQFQFLEVFCLSTGCKFSVKTILNFLQFCPRLRCLGNIHTWGRYWESRILQIYPVLQEQNLAVQLVP